jgi:hypothetical protein
MSSRLVVVEVARVGVVLTPHRWEGGAADVELRGALEHHAACAVCRDLLDPLDVASDFPGHWPSDGELL